ncbi:MAG: serine/threonine protein kinase [Deltaproteobacteria bacterium]|nr:serine/threonine protein kinase [Deltaproteobacteria bacterium]
MKNCAGDNTIAALIAGALDPTAARGLDAHLDACASCRQLVASLGRGLSALGGEHGAQRVGRYELQRVIGVGGMGVVYEARDSVLDRRVAVKLLRPDSACDPQLLLAEARAMARLSHRNIVAIHDAGVAGGRVYLCMEYVAGTTLREWLAAEVRPVREIVGVFAAAGRGLAYIHDERVVHLDFKPDNVLVDRSGRVVVTDFGVAAIVARTGVLAGTPRYMAPEQKRGVRADARADQFAFATALREALGERAPSWAREVIMRGTNERAAERYDSMNELVTALEAGARRTRRRVTRALAVAATVGLAMIAVREPQIVTRVVEHERVERVPVGVPVDAAAPTAVPSAEPERVTASAPSRDAGAIVRALSIALAPQRERHATLFALDVPALAMAAGDRGDSGVCDDDNPRTCASDPPPWCPSGSVLALQDGCWTCADEHGCAPLGIPHACDDGSPLRCTRARPHCTGRELPSIRGGCWECADPFVCTALSPSMPVQRPLPNRCGDGTCDPGEDSRNCATDCGSPNGHGSGDGSGTGSGGGSGWGSGGGSGWGSGGGSGWGSGWGSGGGSGWGSGGGSGWGSGGGSGSGGAHCGNGMCEPGENHASCASDCCETTGSGACVAVCGNGFCENGEDPASCPSDCCRLGSSGACL